MKNRSKALSSSAVFISIVLLIASLYFAKEVFIPLALSILLTFLLTPVVQALQRWRVHRTLAVILTVIVALAVTVSLTWVTVSQVYSLAKDLSKYEGNLRTKIQSVRGSAKHDLEKTSKTVEELSKELSGDQPSPKIAQVQVVEGPPNAIQLLRGAIAPLLKPLGTAAVVIVFVTFMLLHREDLRDRIIRLIGIRRLNVTVLAFDDAALRVSRYLLMQFLINSIQGTLVAIGLILIGVPNAILWGVLTIALRFIPYLGPLVAATMPVLVSLAVFDNWTGPLMTIGLVSALELISNNVLEPWLYGSRTGLSPVALIVAAVFWTWLWGGVGLLLSTPLTVCLVVMGKYIPQLSFLSILLSDEPVLTPRTRFYQRLLADDLQEAEQVLKEAAANLNPVELMDRILVPAITLAEKDYFRRFIDEERRGAILNSIDELAQKTSEIFKVEPDEIQEHPLVLCVPVRDKGDELASSLFVRLLRAHGIAADFLSVEKLAGEVLEVFKEKDPKAICLSAVPPYSILHGKYLCKRIRVNLPRIPILALVWNAKRSYAKSQEQLMRSGADRVGRSAAEGLEQIRYFFPDIPLRNPTVEKIGVS
ncbi:MAG TPA: AI-2E family transporter [Acidobacteriota bacterium]|nr:AI-2E family transporter [Acidobacteriota bacterium]